MSPAVDVPEIKGWRLLLGEVNALTTGPLGGVEMMLMPTAVDGLLVLRAASVALAVREWLPSDKGVERVFVQLVPDAVIVAMATLPS